MFEGALQIAEKREAKGKGEKERYTHLNADSLNNSKKKAFLSEQCKEIEENNRRGKPIDLSRKLEIPREHAMQTWAQLSTEKVWT